MASLKVWFISGMGLLAFGSRLAHGETATLLPSKDNTLYESQTGAFSSGVGKYLYVGRNTQPVDSRRRGLMAFDIAAGIPAGMRITRVRLSLNMSRTIARGTDISLHRVKADWGEGSSDAEFPFDGRGGDGAPATNGDATWLHRTLPSPSWTEPGGDFEAVPSATTSVGDAGSYAWESPGMVRDVQAWLDNPGSNFGWLLQGDEGASTTTKRFGCREHPDSAQRPTLLIELELPPPPSPVPAMTWGGSAILAALALVAGVLLHSRSRARPTRD